MGLLAQRIRAKYPGVYDDLSDDALEQAVLAKHPEYRDLVGAPSPGPNENVVSDLPGGGWDQESADRSQGSLQSQLTSGVMKGMGTTASGLGKLVTKGVNLLGRGRSLAGGELPTESFDWARKELQPKTSAEKTGFGAEQLAEFFAPGGGATKPLSLAAQEALRAMTISSGQKGELDSAAGVVPGALAGSIAKVARFAPVLKDRAARLLERTLRPSGRMKGEVAQAAPHALEQMKFGEIAAKTPDQLSQSFGNEYNEAQGVRVARMRSETAKGSAIDMAPVYRELTSMRDKLKVGQVVPDDPSYKAIIERLQTLDDIFEQYGGTRIPIEAADRLRAIFAKPLWKTGAPPADLLSGSQQGSAKLVADSIRQQIAQQFPDIGALGTEAHQFGTLRRAAQRESQASRTRQPGLAGEVLAIRNLVGAGIGGGIGYREGGAGGAVAGGTIGAAAPFAILRLISSPRWMTLSSATQYRLGKLIEAGDFEQAGKLAARLFAGTAGDRETLP